MRVIWAGALASLLFVSGCFGGGLTETVDSTVPADAVPWFVKALIQPPDHDHYDPLDHLNLSSRNVEVVGWDPLASPWYDGMTMPGHSCSTIAHRGQPAPEGERKVMYTISYASDVAFTAIDVTDPAKPTWLSEFVLPHAHADGIDVTQDGRYVVIGSEGTQGGDKPTGQLRRPTPSVPVAAAAGVRTLGEDCTKTFAPLDEEPPADDHVYLVDVTDPENPTYVDSTLLPHPYGPHMIRTGHIDGKDYVFAVAAFLMVPNPVYPEPNGNLFFGGTQTSRVFVYEIGDKPTGGTGLTLVSTISITPQNTLPDPTAAEIIHDAWFQKHPVTGEHLLYLAAWDEGVVLYNLDDPRMPTERSRWTEYDLLDPYEATGNIHHVVPIDGLWDGRHYTVLGPENFFGPPGDLTAGPTYIIDTTDPSAPKKIGQWSVPVKPQEDGWNHSFQFSPHFLRVADGYIYMAHFHAGAWVIDVSTPEKRANPEAVAVFVPDRVPDEVFDGRRVLNSLPLVLDLEIGEDGLMYIPEWQSGLYVVQVHFDQEP